MPINYQNAKIYKIVNSANTNIYIGSSTMELSKRMTGHRRDAKIPSNASNKFYEAVRIIGVENFSIILDHAFPCNTKEELLAEEFRTLNLVIARGTQVYNMMINGRCPPELKARMAKAKLGELNGMFGCGSIVFCPKGHWRFQYYENKKTYGQSFSCRKYGDWTARLMAEQARKLKYPAWRTDEEIALAELGNLEFD